MRYTTIGSDSPAARQVSALSLGTMWFGTRTDEATSFSILDRYVTVGGNFIDTSDSYLFFVNGTQGGESEAVLGRWRASRGIGDEIVMATKVGAGPSRRRPASTPRARACPARRSGRPVRAAGNASAWSGSTCTTRTSLTRPGFR